MTEDNSNTLHWYERIIWSIWAWMMRRRGYKYIDVIPGKDGLGIQAFIFDSENRRIWKPGIEYFYTFSYDTYFTRDNGHEL